MLWGLQEESSKARCIPPPTVWNIGGASTALRGDTLHSIGSSTRYCDGYKLQSTSSQTQHHRHAVIATKTSWLLQSGTEVYTVSLPREKNHLNFTCLPSICPARGSVLAMEKSEVDQSIYIMQNKHGSRPERNTNGIVEMPWWIFPRPPKKVTPAFPKNINISR